MRGANSVAYTDAFKKDYTGLDAGLQDLVDACIADILKDPIPGARRAHSVTPSGKKPTIFTLDVTSNKAYKMSYQMTSGAAILRRVGTHKFIDRNC